MIRGRLKRVEVDAVLQIHDLAELDVPFFIFQDLSYDVLLRLWDEVPYDFPRMSRNLILERRDRQHAIYQRATGVLAMSGWFGKTLVEWTGLPNSKVHVVLPGANTLGQQLPPRRSREARRKLLFVGRDFYRKGGDLVVKALGELRKDFDPAITLTIAGPARWPLNGRIPDGINFLGEVRPQEIVGLYDDHGLFVMPSRFEAFGIVFAEALTRGLPCIARNAYAMPELVRPGQNGDLISNDDPQRLAECIAGVLLDDGLYDRCYEASGDLASFYSWSRAARDAHLAITDAVQRPGPAKSEWHG